MSERTVRGGAFPSETSRRCSGRSDPQRPKAGSIWWGWTGTTVSRAFPGLDEESELKNYDHGGW